MRKMANLILQRLVVAVLVSLAGVHIASAEMLVCGAGCRDSGNDC
jgi:hypothetical protein